MVESDKDTFKYVKYILCPFVSSAIKNDLVSFHAAVLQNVRQIQKETKHSIQYITVK